MMAIKLRSILLGLFCLGCCGAAGSPVQAADCALLLQDLSRLTGMMQRQGLLNRAIRECPDDYQINYHYAYHLERLRRYEQALVYYEAAVRLQPDFARGYFGMGDVYLAQGQSKLAMAAFTEGLRLDPDNIWGKRSYQRALQWEKPGPREAQEQTAGQEKPREASAAGKEDALVGAAPAAQPAQAGPPAEDDAAAPLTAEGFVQGMTGQEAKPGTGEQEGQVFSLQIQYEISSGELTEEAKAVLDSVVCQALQSPELQDRRFEVAGHTDDRGTPETNMYFARIRATGVRDYLVEQCGIAPDRLTVVYYGQERPLYPNTSKKNRMRNRRVEFRLLP
ncbi:MAG: OmpA family protein [Thermodesulfobacteriota bacterium]